LGAAARPAKRCAGRIRLGEYLPRVGQEIGTIEREGDLARGAPQQLDPELLLELGQPGAGHRRRKAQFAPSGRDVQPVGRHDKKAQVVRIHRDYIQNPK